MATYIYTIRAVREDMVKSGLNEKERAAFQAHAAYLEELNRQGTLILVGRTLDEESVGMAIIKADSEEEAAAIMNADPFVSQGIVRGKLQPFGLVTFPAT